MMHAPSVATADKQNSRVAKSFILDISRYLHVFNIPIPSDGIIHGQRKCDDSAQSEQGVSPER